MKFPDHVTVYHKLSTVPGPKDDSFRLDVLILSERHRRAAARCIEDIVLYDYQKGIKIEMGARSFILEAFRDTVALQEDAIRENSSKARDLADAVRSLELASWNKNDAKEDVGQT